MGETIDLSYREQGEGIPLVLLHGYPLDHRIWADVLPHLKKNIHVITPDLRGHGNSPVPDGVYTMPQLVDDVVRLLDKLKIEKAVIAGHSMGGYVTFEFWHDHPERISGIALVATRANPDPEQRRAERMQNAAEAKQGLTANIINSMLVKVTRRTELYPRVREIMEGTSPLGIAGILPGIASRADANPWLPGIHVPVTVIAGREDQLIPVKESIEMAEKIPNAKLVLVAHAGHLVMMEEPSIIAKALNDLILRVGEHE